MNNYSRLVSFHDTVNAPYILWNMIKGRTLTANTMYEAIACKRCRKIDERAALKMGLSDTIAIASKRAAFLSRDDLYIVSERAKGILSELLQDSIQYIRIGDTGFYVASAKTVIQPNVSDEGFRFFGGTCGVCGRPREVVWGKKPPSIPYNVPFVSVNLEGTRGAREQWIVSENVATELELAASVLTGMVLAPKEISNKTPN